jgi:hypothetical protein
MPDDINQVCPCGTRVNGSFWEEGRAIDLGGGKFQALCNSCCNRPEHRAKLVLSEARVRRLSRPQ